MLNENGFKILFVLNNMCGTGYYTLDKCDIFAELGEDFADKENFDKHLKTLAEDKFIDLKYLDEEACCLLVTDEAKKVVATILEKQKAEQAELEAQRAKRQRTQKKVAAAAIIHKHHGFENVSEELLPSELTKKEQIVLQKHFGGRFKSFLIGLLGGLLGGSISGAIFMIISMFV